MNRVKFGDVVQEIKINVDRTTDDHEFFIAGEHMDSNNIHITRRGRFSESDVGPAFIRLFRPGQVLYGSRRTYLRKVAVADFEGITSNTTFVLETKDSNRLLQGLLPYIMLTDRFSEYAINNSKGSTNPYILFKDLAAYEFDLPTIEEQRQLVVLLSACDRAKEAYKRLIKQTDEVVKSQFIEMFGDCIENEKEWPTKPLMEVLAEGRTVTYGIVKTEDDIPGGVPVFRPVDISQGHVPHRAELKRTSAEISQQYKRTVLKGNELLITVRGSIGETFQITDEFSGCNVARNIVPLEANSEILDQGFLKIVLDSPAFQRKLASLTKGVALKGINMNEFKMCPIILPPLSLQRDCVRFFNQSDKSKFELTQAISRIDDMIKALMQG